MTAPTLLDLYCGAGGATRGYQLAGFHVTGVDHVAQPRYVGDAFVQADALEFLAEHGHGFDAIHASPTCQTRAKVTAWRGRREDHPDTLIPTLQLLRSQSVPWVVENVPEAVTVTRPDFKLCGTQFGLDVRRHRIFETGSWSGYSLVSPCSCVRNPWLLPFEHKAERAFADAMGCTWMTTREARQAIPPVFTEYVGCLLIGQLREAA